MAKRKYGAKKDANHNEIVDALVKMGAGVIDLSSMGCGVPDICVWCPRGWTMVDIKNPETRYGRRGLNKRQKEWADKWQGGPVFLLHSIEEAQMLVEGKHDQLDRYPDDRRNAHAMEQAREK